MHADCSLCSLRTHCGQNETCPEAPLLAYAASPILTERVEQLLVAHHIVFERHGQRFEFPPSIPVERIAATLRANLVEAERVDLRLGFGTVDGLLKSDPLDVFCRKLETSWFEQALLQDRFSFHYQPIVDVSRGEIFGHECLVRLEAERVYQGGEIIDAMLLRGEVHRFDSY